jgi:hypothetical protein
VPASIYFGPLSTQHHPTHARTLLLKPLSAKG